MSGLEWWATVGQREEFEAWFYALPENEQRSKTLNSEYEATAIIDGDAISVTVSYEIDGVKPLIYGMFDTDTGDDLTNRISEPEYDRIYSEVTADVIGTMIDAAEYRNDMER